MYIQHRVHARSLILVVRSLHPEAPYRNLSAEVAAVLHLFHQRGDKNKFVGIHSRLAVLQVSWQPTRHTTSDKDLWPHTHLLINNIVSIGQQNLTIFTWSHDTISRTVTAQACSRADMYLVCRSHASSIHHSTGASAKRASHRAMLPPIRVRACSTARAC